MRLSSLFEECLRTAYTHTEDGVDFALKRRGGVLYIFLEDSDGAEDWQSNLDFPAKAYARRGDTVFYAHRGFLKAWESLLPHVEGAVHDGSLKSIVTVGYSHGGGLAVLCHEYVWHEREDLRESILGYGFGAPRVLWGLLSPSLKKRWARFTVVRNMDDPVTHLPPAFLGYSHVGRLLEIGEKGKYPSVDAHRPENILTELKKYEARQS